MIIQGEYYSRSNEYASTIGTTSRENPKGRVYFECGAIVVTKVKVTVSNNNTWLEQEGWSHF